MPWLANYLQHPSHDAFRTLSLCPAFTLWQLNICESQLLGWQSTKLMNECASVLPEWKYPQGDKLQFGVRCISGPGGELFGEVHEVMSAAPRIFRNLEEDLMCKRCGEVGQRQGGNGTEHPNCVIM